MAHIADFMVNTTKPTVGLNNYIARELSPHSAHDVVASDSSISDEKEKYIWRMHQPTETRKYQLFPGVEKLSLVVAGRSSESEISSSAMAPVGPATDKILPPGPPVRKVKEQSLIRRRKVSVPELGPMTTVQEVAMDSPTIPGRPPLHERSISAPGNTWRHHLLGDGLLSLISGSVLDERAELEVSRARAATPQPPRSSPDTLVSQTVNRSRPSSPKGPLSPKSLTPLVIPGTSQSQRIHGQSSNSRLRNEFQRPEVPPKSSKPKDSSPYRSPYTPMSSTTSLSLPTPQPVPTPQSAPEAQSSEKPWNTSTSHSPSPLGRSRGQSDTAYVPVTTQQQLGHRRGDSEGSNSVMNRGRPPRRRGDSTMLPMKENSSRRSPSAEEQNAFASLPSGVQPKDAHSHLSPTEFDTLRKQALGQAARFEVLQAKDVEALSRELRGLDERCDYLRKTHRSLRSGRRNLHDRICSYLRSPRVAKFSHDSILKQEEALSELDSSIDDWVTKLEQAENRRTRVRQKLLEHVAAALIMQPSSSAPNSASHGSNTNPLASLTRVLNGENTPPRSPTKREAMSPDPEISRVVEEVRVVSPEAITRGGKEVQSIRIYADSDVYALLADVEQEITRMGEWSESDPREKEREDRREEEAALNAPIMLSATTYESLPARTYTPPIPYNNVSVRN